MLSRSVSRRYNRIITFIFQAWWSNEMANEELIKLYHHPNPEIKSFLTMENIYPASVEFFKNPFDEIENKRLQRIGTIASQIVRDIMAVPGVKEIRIKPKEIRMKKEAYASWDEIEEKVFQILSRALRKKKIKRVK